MKFWIVALALTAPTPSLSTWFSSTCAADNGFLSPALRIGLKKEPALLVCDSGHTASQQQRCGCARSRVRLITSYAPQKRVGANAQQRHERATSSSAKARAKAHL